MSGGERSRLAEVLAALSPATDLGATWPPETALKICLVAAGLARRVGLAEPEVADVRTLPGAFEQAVRRRRRPGPSDLFRSGGLERLTRFPQVAG